MSDLNEAAEPYKDDIVQARLDLYTREGVVRGFPTHVGAFVAFYNDPLLKKAGIDYKTIKTWQDFQDAGAAYNKKTGNAFGVASTGVNMVEHAHHRAARWATCSPRTATSR